MLSLLGGAMLAVVASSSAAADKSSSARSDQPPSVPPEYPIPSSCNFVTPQDTGARNINKLYGHYFCRPQGTATEQLFIFMPGTGTND